MEIYNWYRLNTDIQPIVVDADDFIEFPEVVIPKLCEILGMDGEGVRIEWAAMDEGEREGMQGLRRRFLSTLIESTGVLKGKSSRGVDLGRKREEWEGEFGVEGAEWLGGRVQGAMGDYEFLRGVRVF
jgi:hypothetical protein